MELDKSHLDQIERDIRPQMVVAITLPVTVEGYSNLVVYVGAMPYFTGDYKQEDLEATIKSIAERLTLAPEDVPT